jgi:ketosteroid isomerase-like protein
MIEEYFVQRTLNRYSEAASRADWDAVLSTYLPDGVWEIPALGAKFAGHASIREGLMRFAGPMDYFVQVNAPALITLDGDSATARSVIRECGKYAGRDEALEVLGFYADRLMRAAEGWKFAHRIFELRGMHGFPLQPAGGG